MDSLLAGPGVFICGDCVTACAAILQGGAIDAGSAQRISPPDIWPNEVHLRLLKARDATAAAARAAVKESVDILRARAVSWAIIGAALGVSRQAAWERFG